MYGQVGELHLRWRVGIMACVDVVEHRCLERLHEEKVCLTAVGDKHFEHQVEKMAGVTAVGDRHPAH